MNKKVYIVLPAFNEWNEISKVLDGLRQSWYDNIIVVNDWSVDDTESVLKKSWVEFVSHPVNRWAWAATQTWFELAKLLWADIVITMDSDGQHNAPDIKKLVDAMEKYKVDVVIWSRFLEKQKIPIHRRFFNFIWNIVTWFFFWLYVTDSQSWLKAFNRKALEKIQIKSNWYEFCSEIIQKINRNNLNCKEIPITVNYTQYSQSKWQSFFNWIKTVWKLALHAIIT